LIVLKERKMTIKCKGKISGRFQICTMEIIDAFLEKQNSLTQLSGLSTNISQTVVL